MPSRDLILVIAIFGCLGLSVSAFSLCAQEARSEKIQSIDQPEERSSAVGDQIAPINPEPVTSAVDFRKPDCDASISKDVADLCVQQRMAKAAEESLAINRIQTVVGIVGGILLLLTFWANIRAANAAVDAAAAGERSAKATEDTLVAGQRPWISVELGMRGGIAYTAEEARMTIDFAMKNVGNSPAINVWVEAKIALIMNGAKTSMSEFKELCATVRNGPEEQGLLGHTIFPGDTLPFSVNLGITRTEIENSIPQAGKVEFFNPDIIGCVSYRFPFQSGIHTTEFFVSIRRANPTNPNVDLAFKISDGNVPQNQIVMRRTFIGGNAN